MENVAMMVTSVVHMVYGFLNNKDYSWKQYYKSKSKSKPI